MALAGWLVGQAMRNNRAQGNNRDRYAPKFCRQRGCTLLHRHDGPHNGATGLTPARVVVPPGSGQRAERRAARRANGVYGVNHGKLHHPRRRAQTDPIVRENMRRTRARQPLIVRVTR